MLVCEEQVRVSSKLDAARVPSIDGDTLLSPTLARIPLMDVTVSPDGAGPSNWHALGRPRSRTASPSAGRPVKRPRALGQEPVRPTQQQVNQHPVLSDSTQLGQMGFEPAGLDSHNLEAPLLSLLDLCLSPLVRLSPSDPPAWCADAQTPTYSLEIAANLPGAIPIGYYVSSPATDFTLPALPDLDSLASILEEQAIIRTTRHSTSPDIVLVRVYLVPDRKGKGKALIKSAAQHQGEQLVELLRGLSRDSLGWDGLRAPLATSGPIPVLDQSLTSVCHGNSTSYVFP
jgi:hypothetical protein